MRGAAYERAANLYHQLKALPWWAFYQRHQLGKQIERTWKEQ